MCRQMSSMMIKTFYLAVIAVPFFAKMNKHSNRIFLFGLDGMMDASKGHDDNLSVYLGDLSL